MTEDEEMTAIIEALAAPLRRQDAGAPVYTAQCREGCMRVYVGVDRPLYCGEHPKIELDVREIT